MPNKTETIEKKPEEQPEEQPEETPEEQPEAGESAEEQLEARVEALEQRIEELSEALATISIESEDASQDEPDTGNADSEYGEALDLDQLLGL